MVHFVGAGCGAEDLITVRGMRLLQEADCVIYAGSLVNPKLLSYCKKECEILNSATMTLEQVIEQMLQKEKEGKTTVRLHTGEPSLYGAIREQMDLLEQEGISYDSCPGVSACFGAAASMDLEYTLPGISQSLIITRMEGKTKVPEKEALRELAKHQTSMAIYLSTTLLEEVKQELLLGGYEKDTPVTLAYKVTWPEEKIIRTTLEKLPQVAREENITKTAIVLVGAAMAGTDYEKSKLYDAAFTTMYRKGTDEIRDN